MQKKSSDRLLVFCAGWGMDEHPFLPIDSKTWNVLMFYEYSDLCSEYDFASLFAGYKEIVLLSWSMGVWAGQQLFHHLSDVITLSIAINGTLSPIDDRSGIPRAVIRGTLESLDNKQLLKFYYRMCRDRELYRSFLSNQPQRNIESQRVELAAILASAKQGSKEQSIYDCAIISEQDFIMPTKNQLNYWPENMVKRVDGAHFLFYSYGSWDEIVESLRCMK